MNSFHFLLHNIILYRKYYYLMLLGPIIGGFYSPIYNYAVKLIINAISFSDSFEYNYLIAPVYMFIIARLSLEVAWKINEFAKLVVEPLVKKNIILNAYDIIQNKKYSFFQNNAAGNIASKIKGLIDSYEALSREILQNGFFARICKNIGSIIAIATINIWLGFAALIWSIGFVLIMLPFSIKLSKMAIEDAKEKHNVIGLIIDKIINILSILLFSAKKKEYLDLSSSLDKGFIVAQKKYINTQFYYNLSQSYSSL